MPRTERLPPGLLLTLALLAAISPLATAMYLPAMPQLAADLATSPQQAQLTVSAFLAGLAAGQLVIGPISDRTGRRTPLLLASSVCVLASVVCTIAPSIDVLIAARAVQGFTGAAGVVLGRAVIADTVTGPAAARAFSLMMTIGAAAPVIAPLIGGAVSAVAGWRGVFAVLTGIAVVMAVCSAVFVNESLPPQKRHDTAALSGLREVAGRLGERQFLGFSLSMVLSYAALTAYVAASPFVLQGDLGLSTLQFSIVFAVNAAGLALAAFINARLVARVGAIRLLAVGIAAQAFAAMALLVAQLAGEARLPVVLAAFWLTVAGMGFTVGNATSLALGRVGGAYGSGSALLGAGQFAIAALIAPLVGLGGGASVLPAAVTMTVVTLIAALALWNAGRGIGMGNVVHS